MTVASHSGLTAAVGIVLLFPQRHIAVPGNCQHLHSVLGQDDLCSASVSATIA